MSKWGFVLGFVPVPLPSPENPAAEAHVFNLGLSVLRFHVPFYHSLSHANSLLLCGRLDVRTTMPYAFSKVRAALTST